MKKTIVVSLSILSMCCLAIGLTGCSNNVHVHSYDKQVISDEYLTSSATCTEKATYYYSCECGEKGTETFEYGSPLGHSFTNYISDNNATCTQDGTKTAKCDRCDETDTVEDINSKLDHSYTKQIVSDEYLASPATCTEKARYYYSCECGAKGTKTFEYGSTTKHNFVNGSCTYCGKKQEASQCLAFTLLDDETYEVSGKGSYTNTEIVIPSVYNDKPVTSIGDRAFEYCRGLTSVTIGNKVTSIGNGAFSGCRRLTSVTIPGNVTSIGRGAFKYCRGLTSVTIGNSVTSIGKGAFLDCSRLTSITYKGTIADWNNINKGAGWNGNVPTTCVIHCTDGKQGIYE